MGQVIADRRDIDFVLHEQFEVGKFSKTPKFSEFTKKTIDLIINEARNLAVKEILPTQREGDAQPALLQALLDGAHYCGFVCGVV